ncbi:MAG: RNA polymerase sigma factor [Deltaproteobacteria bacterium]|nr:RNA polymerase sigma factor [Deltaproteobacteria bacterium]
MHVLAEQRSTPPAAPASRSEERFLALYDELSPMVFRMARRLGVPDEALDDVVQEIFVVVHRRLPDFAARSSPRTWVTGIALRVVQGFRRGARRRLARIEPTADVDAYPVHAHGPEAEAERGEAVAFLRAFLDALDDGKRTAFVLCELEQLTAPEIAEATGANLNTVYARIRAARRLFEDAIAHRRAPREGGVDE